MQQINTGLLKYAILGVGLASPISAMAEIKFNGFGSVRATYVSTESDDFVVPGIVSLEDNELSFNEESIFGLQAKADLGAGLSATIQMVADGKNDFDLEAEWAYFSYKLNNKHTLSVGRFANPIFYQSQYENVGYAHDYGRLPNSVYFGFDFSTIEGVALDSSYLVAGINIDTKLLHGTWDGTITLGASGREETSGFDSITSANIVVSKDWWSIFAGIFVPEFKRGSIDDFFQSAVAAPAALALQNGATTAEVDQLNSLVEYAGKDGKYWYTGYSIDYNNFLSSLEYTKYGIKDTMFADVKAWYLSVGYRFDEFTVNLRREKLERELGHYKADFIQHPILNAAARAINDSTRIPSSFDGVGASLRYDFHPNAALKLDYFTGNNDLIPNSDYDILAVGVDVVF